MTAADMMTAAMIAVEMTVDTDVPPSNKAGLKAAARAKRDTYLCSSYTRLHKARMK
jgi:hypothetical protein